MRRYKIIHKLNLITNLFFAGLLFIAVSCGKDDEDGSTYVPSTQKQETSSLSKPTYKKNLTTTTLEDVSFGCRFDNGGDTFDNMSCYVHWKKYSGKQSETPKASNLTKNESMRMIASTKTSTSFNRTHSDFNGGDYIYYYFECSNSKYTTKTDVKYCIVKR